MSEHAKVTKAVGALSVVTFISRIFGFLRVMVIAKVFGAGMVADAFFVAFRISNILRELLAEGSMSAAFIPVFSEYLHTRSKEEARQLASSVFYILLFILVGIVMLGVAFSPEVVSVIGRGFESDPPKFAMTVYLTRIMFPYILFVGLSAVTMGVLNSMGSFASPALAPVMLNISMIGFALFLSPRMANPIAGLAIGVVFGGLLQLLIQIPTLRKKGMGFSFMMRLKDEGVRRIGRLTVPVIGSQAVTQINIFVSSIIATYLPEGSVSYLYYAMYLYQFPHGIFGVSIATAVLPSMSRQASVGDLDGLKQTLSFGLRYIFFIMVPAMVGLIVLRVPITSLLLQRGTFTYQDTIGTAYALLFFSLGLWAYSGVRIVNAAFYSLQDTRTPVMGAFVSVSAINMTMLLTLFRKRMGMIGGRKILTAFLKTAASAALMGVVCRYTSMSDVWALSGHTAHKAYLAGLSISAGILTYAAAQYMLKSEEMNFLIQTYKNRKR